MDINVRKAVTQSDSDNNVRVTFNVWEQDTPELREIITNHLVSWAKLFANKNSEYGSGSAFELGERGQFSDIYRKIIKLKRAMWDEDESVLTTESVDEILKDLIGHCFLTLEMRRRRLIAEESAGTPESDSFVIKDLYKVESDGNGSFDFVPPQAPNPLLDTVYRDGLGGEWKVGDLVTFKQHLGKGHVFRVSKIDGARTHAILAEAMDGSTGAWVHSSWLSKVQDDVMAGRADLPEIKYADYVVEQLKTIERAGTGTAEYFGDNVNRDAEG